MPFYIPVTLTKKNSYVKAKNQLICDGFFYNSFNQS